MQNKPYFFFWKQGFPKGGEGGPTLGKNSRFFFGVASLIHMFYFAIYLMFSNNILT